MDTSFRDEYSDKRRIGLAVAEYRTSGLCLAGLLSLATKAREHPCHDGRAAGGFEPPLNETPSSKLQAPEKFQISNTKLQNQMPRQTARRTVFELGAWCFF